MVKHTDKEVVKLSQPYAKNVIETYQSRINSITSELYATETEYINYPYCDGCRKDVLTIASRIIDTFEEMFLCVRAFLDCDDCATWITPAFQDVQYLYEHIAYRVAEVAHEQYKHELHRHSTTCISDYVAG